MCYNPLREEKNGSNETGAGIRRDNGYCLGVVRIREENGKYAGETLDEAMARTAAFDATIESLPGFVESAEDFDGEYEVARLMENARKHAKLTQAQVAERMGTTQSSVARMLKSNLTLGAMARYIKACDARLKVVACYM